MTAAEKKLNILKELLKNEPDKKSLYAQDLRLSIARAKKAVESKGYEMVDK